MFTNKKDPLVDAVKSVMNEGNLKRQVEEAVNNHFGVSSRKAIPHEHLAEYDAVLSEAYKCAMEEEKGSEPRNKKEANLAKMKPPHDEITHADVLKGRGVIRQEETQLDEKATEAQKEKVAKVMHKWKQGKEHIGKSKETVPVTKKGQKQAVAIALSQAGLSKKSKEKQMDESVESIMEEIRVNLEEQLMEAYATGDSEVFEDFVLSLNEEQREILGLNEVFGDYAGDPSILDRASRQTYSNQQRQAAGKRTVSVDRPAPTSRSAPTARSAAPTGTAARPAAPAAPAAPTAPAARPAPAGTAARPAAQMGPRQSPSDMGAPPAGSPQYQNAGAGGRADLTQITARSPVERSFPAAQETPASRQAAQGNIAYDRPTFDDPNRTKGVGDPGRRRTNFGSAARSPEAPGQPDVSIGPNATSGNPSASTETPKPIRESLESFIRNKFIKG